jgi:hypothetical protein
LNRDLENIKGFATVLLTAVLALEFAEGEKPAEPRRPTESDQSLPAYLGLGGRNRAKRQTATGFSDSPVGWTGQPFPVGALMPSKIPRHSANSWSQRACGRLSGAEQLRRTAVIRKSAKDAKEMSLAKQIVGNESFTTKSSKSAL